MLLKGVSRDVIGAPAPRFSGCVEGSKAGLAHVVLRLAKDGQAHSSFERIRHRGRIWWVKGAEAKGMGLFVRGVFSCADWGGEAGASVRLGKIDTWEDALRPGMLIGNAGGMLRAQAAVGESERSAGGGNIL